MKTNREDVRSLYRVVLGREPESEAVIDTHLDTPSLEALISIFVNSPENRLNNLALVARAAPAGKRFIPLDRAANSIEYLASDEQLSQCLQIVAQQWSALGEEKPHYSVLTDARFNPDELDKYEDDFWQSGNSEIDGVLRMLKRIGIVQTKSLHALELGCGVGRVTYALAPHFASVAAYDISAPHLKIANKRAQKISAKNIAFHHVQPDTFLKTLGNQLAPSFWSTITKLQNSVEAQPLQYCDFIYSRIVLQHNPPPVMHHIIQALLACLRPNGIAILQLPTYRLGYAYAINTWLRHHTKSDMEMHCLPQQAVSQLAAQANCEILEVSEDASTGSDRYISNTFAIQKKVTPHELF